MMKMMWSGQFAKQGFSCEPMPVSKNGPPVIFGGQSEGAMIRVATIGDGWHPVGISAQKYSEGMQKIIEIKNQNYIWSLRINFAANQDIPDKYTGTDGEPRIRLTGNTDEIISKISEYQKIGLEHLVCDIRANSKDEYFEQLKIVGQIKKSF